MILPQRERLHAEHRRYGIHERQHLTLLASEPETTIDARVVGADLVRRGAAGFLGGSFAIQRQSVQAMRDQADAQSCAHTSERSNCGEIARK